MDFRVDLLSANPRILRVYHPLQTVIGRQKSSSYWRWASLPISKDEKHLAMGQKIGTWNKKRFGKFGKIDPTATCGPRWGGIFLTPIASAFQTPQGQPPQGFFLFEAQKVKEPKTMSGSKDTPPRMKFSMSLDLNTKVFWFVFSLLGYFS